MRIRPFHGAAAESLLCALSRSFCGGCGSSLFCDNTSHPDRVDIALGSMDDPIDRPPQFHIHFDSRAPWVTVSDDLPRLGGETGLEPLPDPTPRRG